jgi:hypothetical protein
LASIAGGKHRRSVPQTSGRRNPFPAPKRQTLNDEPLDGVGLRSQFGNDLVHSPSVLPEALLLYSIGS